MRDHTKMKAWLASNVIISTDGLYSEYLDKVIDHPERDMMYKKAAEGICEGGGDVLQIGFGIGNVAYHINKQNISSHTIIEEHPQIVNFAALNGFGNNIIQKPWRIVCRDYIKKGIRFDAIYFQELTSGIYLENEIIQFQCFMDELLKPGGRYSFNGFMDNGVEIINRWNLDEWGYFPKVKKVSIGFAAQESNNIGQDTLHFKGEILKEFHYVNWFIKPNTIVNE